MENGICVVVEMTRGEIREVSFELLGLGRKLAEALNVPLAAVLMGKMPAPESRQLGMADAVVVLEGDLQQALAPSAAASALKTFVDSKHPLLILLPGTNAFMGVGSILAARTHLPFVNFCKNLQVESGTVSITTQLFGGKILVDLHLPENRGIISVYPGSFPAEAGRREGSPALETLPVSEDGAKISFTNLIEPAPGDVDITKQDILLAVGRGIQNQDNLPLVEEVAKALGGVVCASRPVIDQGWLPLSRQVGKSGMTVAPKVYLALGISGAPEHVEGMKNSQLIIAVNTDPKAPIFNVAHFGVCQDVLEVLPVLAEQLKSHQEGR